jgi:serine phosphatase RsbU (regulator of sigma subunit)/tetratricopeptide (TPR) repeat protein
LWDGGCTEEETTLHAQELLTFSKRIGYERGVAWGTLGMAKHKERRDNVAFGKIANEAAQRFEELNDSTGRAFAQSLVAAFHFYSADYELALHTYLRALRRFEALHNTPQTAWTLYRIAILYGYQGNYIVSLSYQFKALRLFEQLNLTLGVAASNEDLGVALFKIGSTTKALEFYTRAMQLYQLDAQTNVQASAKASSDARVANVMTRIADCYLSQKKYDEARTLLRDAMQKATTPTSPFAFSVIVASTVYDVLSDIARAQDSSAQALRYLQQALLILDNTGVQGNDANYAVYRLGRFRYAQRQYDQASSEFHVMLERSLRTGDKRNAARAMLWLGNSAFQEHNSAVAIRYGREAFAAAESIGQLEFATQASELLGNTFELRGELADALRYTKLARKFRDSIATLERTQQLAGMEALYNLDKEKSVSELLKRDNEAQAQAATRQRWLLIGGAVVLVVVLLLAVALWRANARKKAANAELEEKTVRIRAIARIGAEIASNLVLKDAIEVIYDYMNQLMDAPIFNIGDYLPEQGKIVMRYLIEDGEFVPPPTVLMTDIERPAVRCVVERRPVVMNDIDIPVLVGKKPESLVYMPLVAGDQILGVFSVQSLKKNSYPPENVDLLVAVSAYIATAMQNATAFERIRQQQWELEMQAAVIQMNNVELSERNLALEKLNIKITENIAYAQTIQRAVLPHERELAEHLGEHFVLYKPMEIISGDFYWLHRTANATLVAVVDCTGHGVPGAFMSMIGNELLNQIVVEKNITEPAQILTELHLAVRHALKQTNDLESNQDGMDVCLCRIENGCVTFAGARRSLYIVHNRSVRELEGNIKPVGGFQRETQRTFTSQRLDLGSEFRTDSPDKAHAMLYLTSDGYTDQHNSTREKFGTRRFEHLLASHAHQEAAEQLQTFEQALTAHQGATPQRDDITVLGLRLFWQGQGIAVSTKQH